MEIIAKQQELVQVQHSGGNFSFAGGNRIKRKLSHEVGVQTRVDWMAPEAPKPTLQLVLGSDDLRCRNEVPTSDVYSATLKRTQTQQHIEIRSANHWAITLLRENVERKTNIPTSHCTRATKARCSLVVNAVLILFRCVFK